MQGAPSGRSKLTIVWLGKVRLGMFRLLDYRCSVPIDVRYINDFGIDDLSIDDFSMRCFFAQLTDIWADFLTERMG